MQKNDAGDAVRSYLKSIGRVPLLTHEEEITYGKKVVAMMPLQTIRGHLIEEIGHSPSWEVWANQANISVEELKAIICTGELAKRKMIAANLRLVVSIAKKYTQSGLDLLDLIQEGSLGLDRGIEKFDPTRGYRLSTYIYWWIRQAITRAIAVQSRVVRLPVHITETINKIRKAQFALTQNSGHAASIEQVAEYLKLSPERVRECLSHSRQSISLEIKFGENDTGLADLLVADGESPEEFTTLHSLRSDLESLMTELTPRQREVIALRFGFQDGKPLSLSEIGELLALSRERVRQLELQAVNKLKRHCNQLKEYLVIN